MKRNYGIDLLRIIAMIMIPILHVLGQGGILKAVTPLSMNYEAAWLLEIACYCAVNCFALISGYVGISTNFKHYRGLVLWLQVLFYTVFITLLFHLFMPSTTNAKVWLNAFTPATSYQYWYFSAYFALFLFIPFINIALNALTLSQMKRLGITIFVLLSIWQTICSVDFLSLKNGYTFLWLLSLYILGAVIKKTEFGIHRTNGTLFLIYTACILITWGLKYFLELQPSSFIKPNLLVQYNSVTITVASISLLLLCSKLNFKSSIAKGLISFFSPLSFSVYLIHVHPLIWKNLFLGRFVKLAKLNTLYFVLAVLLSALGIYVVSSLIDYVRLQLFRLLHVTKLCKSLVAPLDTLYNGAGHLPPVIEMPTNVEENEAAYKTAN